jgi:hypothetical protein
MTSLSLDTTHEAPTRAQLSLPRRIVHVLLVVTLGCILLVARVIVGTIRNLIQSVDETLEDVVGMLE